MLLALLACDDVTTDNSLATCEVELVSVTPSSGLPGAEITLVGRPFTSQADTAVFLGGERAELRSLSREGCETCDSCREEQACDPCGDDCDACDLDCATTCVESVAFLVPRLQPGSTWIQVFNAEGSSTTLAFEVEAVDSGDTGGDSGGDSGDSGGDSGDSGGGDSGDSGGTDSGGTDSGGTDSGGTDSGGAEPPPPALGECPA